MLTMLLVLLRSTAAWSAEPASTPCGWAEEALLPERDLDTHLRQARLFEKKGWLEDAAREAAMARATTEGAHTPEAWATSARIARSLQRIPEARCFAQATLDLQRSGTDTEEARALLQELDRSFGYLVIVTAGDSTTVNLSVTPPKLFASAELKTYTETVLAANRDRQPLPVRLALPGGAYVVNGQSVTVVPGREQEVILRPSETRPAWASPTARLSMGTAWNSAGFARTPDLAGVLRLTTTWPVVQGIDLSLRAGLAVEGTAPRAWAPERPTPAGGAAGAVVEALYKTSVGLDVRVAGSAGVRAVPGLLLDCLPGDPQCSWSALDEDAVDTIAVMGRGRSFQALAALDYRNFGSVRWLGLGVEGGFTTTQGTYSGATTTGSRPFAPMDPSWRSAGYMATLVMSLYR